MAQFTVNRAAVRPLQELQVPGEVGRPLRRRRSARSGRSSARPRSSSIARAATPRPRASRPAAPSTRRSRSSAASPTTPSSRNGRTRSGTSAPGSAPRCRCKDFRKDIIIEVYNEAGQLVLAYKVFRCWVSEFQALPDLDANANAVAIQTLKLENEGWERDYDVAEPARADVHRAGVTDGRDPRGHADRETQRPRRCGSAAVGLPPLERATARCCALLPAPAPPRRAWRAQRRAARHPRARCSARAGPAQPLPGVRRTACEFEVDAAALARELDGRPAADCATLEWDGVRHRVALPDRATTSRHRRGRR